MERYVDFISAKRGLAAALHAGDPAYDALPTYFEERLPPALKSLLTSAVSAGYIGAGVDPHHLLSTVASLSLCASTRDQVPARARRMIGLLLDGLRYEAGLSLFGRDATAIARFQPRCSDRT